MTSKQFLYIVLITFITIIFWVVSDIYHARSKVQIPDTIQALLEPINPNLDREAVNLLQQ